MKRIGQAITTMLSARWFYVALLGFFVFEALWFVLTAAYPMAFDEEFHFGIIKIYAEQWLPFIAEQPPGADQFGAVARDPSFFFYYIMSFPYRFIGLFTDSQTIQVIFLRLINIGLCTAGLVLFRRVLQRAGTSRALTNTALAVFVLIPIAPQLAAHINYDNLLMVLFAWSLLATFNVYESFKQGAADVRSLTLLVILCTCMAITKYAALPLVVALVVFVMAAAYRFFRRRSRALLTALRDGYRHIDTVTKLALVVALLTGLGLFAERYVGNVVMYQQPLPKCDKVLTVEQCLAYGPWARNYKLGQEVDSNFSANPLDFLGTWLGGMHHRLYFAVNGVHDDYTNYRQLPVPAKTAAAIAIAGGLATAIWWRQVFRRNPYLVLFLLVIVVYAGILWVQLYASYSSLGEPVAINGRYLLPVLLPMAAIMGAAIDAGLRQFKKTRIKPYFATGAILLLLYGGGVFTYILRSDPAWYWDSPAARQANHTARTLLRPFIIEGQK